MHMLDRRDFLKHSVLTAVPVASGLVTDGGVAAVTILAVLSPGMPRFAVMA